MSPLTDHQRDELELIERVASCFSLVGTTFIFLTFLSSSDFRRPVNRLIFYASWGNTLCNIATLISESGIKAGQESHLCQFQAFLIQMFESHEVVLFMADQLQVRTRRCFMEFGYGRQCVLDSVQEVQC